MIRKSLAALGALLIASVAAAAPPDGVAHVAYPGVVVIPSAARTTDVTSGWFRSDQVRGVVLVADVTAFAASPVHTCRIELFDIGKDAVVTFRTFINTLTATATLIFGAYSSPGTTANAGLSEFMGTGPPGIWRVVCAATDTDSITYSITAYPVK